MSGPNERPFSLPEPGPGGRIDASLPGGVKLHLRGICAFRDLGSGRMVFLRQVHGALIAENPSGGEEADGMTIRRGLGYPALKLADCGSLLLWSRGWMGAVHAGWRGLVAGAAANLVRAFPEEPVMAVAGPCICPSCYEVGDDVRRLVIDACGGVHPEGRLDLCGALAAQARSAGLACEILRTSGCTRCRADLFHSHRRDATSSRNIIWLEG